MPYIKKSEYEFIQDKLRWRKESAERHRLFEEYIREHSDVKFTHGMCPACMEKLYPDFCRKMLETEDKQ